ncbi:MAG: hypothetical protein RIQ79_2543 [Verrucomicrobiota bacterium]
MKNITLSAEERLIEQARERARANKTTLNQMFREWLQTVTAEEERTQKIDALFARYDAVNAGGKFSREEMNAR